MTKLKLLFISTLTLSLCACSGFFDKDNTPTPSPLVSFTTEMRVANLWHTSTNSGVGDEYLHLLPAVTDQAIFTASKEGVVSANDKATGKSLWSIQTRTPISGGPTASEGLVFVGSRDGDVIALQQQDGAILWKNTVPSEVLAAPAAAHGVALFKTIDGHVTALSTDDGHVLWHYEQVEPTLILRGASAPQVTHHDAVIGFANGNLVKLTLREGSQQWQQIVGVPQGSFTIQRMVDIDADPIVLNNHVYAATYQGRIAAMDLQTGKVSWTYDLSSYSGIAADKGHVYVSDGKSHIWAFDANSGLVSWKQSELEARNITGPAVMGDYIVVGDEQGYLHWISKQDGHFVARVRVNSSGIVAAPVVDNGILYVVTRDGRLAAYRLG